jgi:hypothetical protein
MTVLGAVLGVLAQRFGGGATSAPRRLGLRPEKCTFGARLTMPSRLGLAVRWLMIRVSSWVCRYVGGESPPRQIGTAAVHFSELPRFRKAPAWQQRAVRIAPGT